MHVGVLSACMSLAPCAYIPPGAQKRELPLELKLWVIVDAET